MFSNKSNRKGKKYVVVYIWKSLHYSTVVFFFFKMYPFIVLKRVINLSCDCHMISLVNLKISMSILGAYSQSSPEVSNIKIFFIATSSFDVWVIEHKITGLPRWFSG